MGERCEWKLEVRGSEKRIEAMVGVPVCIFANNGFGDYLFLRRKPEGDGYEEEVFEFFHEGPEISRVDEELETLLGLKVRPPAHDAYPKAVYETGELVQVEDRVQVKVWAQFWKGWQEGVVEYVPGISRMSRAHEYGGLKWVAIRFRDGQVCPLVDPTSGRLRKVRSVARASTSGKTRGADR